MPEFDRHRFQQHQATQPVERRIFGAPIQRGISHAEEIAVHEARVVRTDLDKLLSYIDSHSHKSLRKWARQGAKQAKRVNRLYRRAAHSVTSKLPEPVRITGSYIRKHYLEYPILAVILLGIAVPALQGTVGRKQAELYKLNDASSLLKTTPQSLVKNIGYDAKNAAYTFMAPADEQAAANSQSAGGAHYSAKLNEDASKGISLTDTANKLSIGLTPEFSTMKAKQVDNHIVYPISGSNAQLVYTFEGNGLKEDIVLYSSNTPEASFSYAFNLPSSLEARMQGDGSISIFGADPALYGNISYSSDADKALVQKAQVNSAKNTLMYILPAPVVKGQSANDANKVTARFSLDNGVLTVHVGNLLGRQYPLTIDPTLALASAGDFGIGNVDDNNIDLTSSNQISRGPLTGGDTTGAATQQVTPTGSTGSTGATTLIWNGFIYVIGGQKPVSTQLNTVYYAPITATTGAIGSWTSQSITLGVPTRGAVVYNGRIYLIDQNTGSAYVPINANGSLGTAVTVTTPPQINGANFTITGRSDVVAYNGYIYFNKFDASISANGAYYAPINPDGTLGSWTQTTKLPASNDDGAMIAYNGYMYHLGGGTGSPHSAWTNLTYYTKINSDGSLATCSGVTWCTASNNFTNGREGFGATIMNGYVYILGGCANASDGVAGFCNNNSTGLTATAQVQYSDMQYAPVYANGDLGAWKTGSTTRTGYNYNLVGAYGHLYAGQGASVTSASCPGVGCTNTMNYIASVYNYTVTTAGAITGFSSGTAMGSSAKWDAVTSANGYLYSVGGCTGATANSTTCTVGADSTTVRYATVSSTGTLTWSTTTALPAGRWMAQAVAMSGYLYVLGGCTSTAGTCTGKSDILYNTINPATGQLGATWSTATATLTGVTQGFTVTTYNGVLYVAGGHTSGSSTLSSNIYYFPSTNNTGDLATRNTSSLSGTAYNSPIAAYNGYFYITNGASGVLMASIGAGGSVTNSWSNATTTAAAGVNNGTLWIDKGFAYGSSGTVTGYAPINSNGTWGTWVTTGAPALQRQYSGYAVVGDHLYEWGGCSNTTNFGAGSEACSSSTTTTGIATVGNGASGANASWVARQALPAVRSFSSATVANGYIYTVGGCSVTDCGSSSATGTVYYNKILPDGTLSNPWSTTSNALGVNRAQGALVAVGNYLYMIGGVDASLTKTNTVLYTTVSPTTGDTTASWTSSGSLLANIRGNSAVSYKGYIYVTDGENSATGKTLTTEYTSVGLGGGAPSNPGCGTTWCASTSLPSGAGSLFGAAALNSGRMYFSGGQLVANTSYSSNVYYATLSSGGIGAWSTASTKFNTERYQHVSFVANGYIYVYGGSSSSACLNDMQYAPLLSGGDIGNWQSGQSVATSRAAVTGAYYGGFSYFIGGQPCGSPVATVDMASILSMPQKAQYSKLFVTDKDVTPVKTNQTFSTTGAYINGTYASATRAAVTLGAATAFSLTSGTANTQIGTTQAAYFYLTFNLDDTQNTTFSDTYSSPTTLSFFRMSYHPNTSMRLRGGATFNSGVSQSLDTP
ncbi:MAG: hypothetical protein JWO41_663 [Candidatus Saccharibacteria bacterium]|nr:hypothetical protein [Candidatus Saccharibacteria bacterium]